MASKYGGWPAAAQTFNSPSWNCREVVPTQFMTELTDA
jgi:hypothetical protein